MKKYFILILTALTLLVTATCSAETLHGKNLEIISNIDSYVTVRDNHNSIIGSVSGIKMEWAAIFFFFYFF